MALSAEARKLARARVALQQVALNDTRKDPVALRDLERAAIRFTSALLAHVVKVTK